MENVYRTRLLTCYKALFSVLRCCHGDKTSPKNISEKSSHLTISQSLLPKYCFKQWICPFFCAIIVCAVIVYVDVLMQTGLSAFGSWFSMSVTLNYDIMRRSFLAPQWCLIYHKIKIHNVRGKWFHTMSMFQCAYWHTFFSVFTETCRTIQHHRISKGFFSIFLWQCITYIYNHIYNKPRGYIVIDQNIHYCNIILM